MAIYINDELEKQMESYRERLNWSRIAQDAFEHAIKLEALKGAGKMELAGIERLRASRNSLIERQKAEGHRCGQTWALETADFEQLDRVTNVDLTDLDDEGSQLMLLDAIFDGDGRNAGEDAVHWMELYLDTRSPSIERIEAFIDGAIEVLNEVH